MFQPRLTTLPDDNRYNFYHNIHKALRLGHCRMLAALGAQDYSDAASSQQLLAELRTLICLMRSHLEIENREIHRALEIRPSGASSHAVTDDRHHHQAFAELESLIRAVDVATPGRRSKVGHVLYRRYALFAAEAMEHMHEAETSVLCALHRTLDDSQLHAIETRMMAAISPPELLEWLKLMMPALSHPERVAMLGSLKAATPPQVFDGLLTDTIGPSLEKTAFQAVLTALGLRQAASVRSRQY